MNKDLPSSALVAIGSAVVASVLVTWTLTTFMLSRIDREMDQLHRAVRYEYMMPADAGEEPMDIEEPEVPEAPEL